MLVNEEKTCAMTRALYDGRSPEGVPPRGKAMEFGECTASRSGLDPDSIFDVIARVTRFVQFKITVLQGVDFHFSHCVDLADVS